MTPQIRLFPCLSDNYGFLIHDPINKLTATVDTPDAKVINSVLQKQGWQLTHIFNTHHHYDHVGGNLELKELTGCQIVGSYADASRIPGIDITVQEGDLFRFGNYDIHIYETPGHTIGHIVYYFANHPIAFVGDTLFALGCGRLFEGSPKDMWQSLQKIMQWPDDTQLYCGHEYTQQNAKFALSIDSHNTALSNRAKEIDALREQGTATIPTHLGLEKKTNPFLRANSNDIRRSLGFTNAADPITIFAKIRQLKDNYR